MCKQVVVLLLLIGCCLTAISQVLPDCGHISLPKPAEKIRALVFLSPECPLCRNYAAILNRLDSIYKKELDIIGVFPGVAYTAAEYGDYKEKYNVHFTLVTDTAGLLVKVLQATVTPEVFLIDKNAKVRYSGAIDDWVTGLGKHKPAATRYYLQDAIDACLQNKPVTIPAVKAVGCLINDY